MTQPKYAEAVPNKGRWYVHPQSGERWPSVTNAIDVGVAKPALVPWAAKITAEKAWDLQTLMVASYRVAPCAARRVAERCGRCAPCVVALVKGEHKVVKETAADLGSRVHALVEAHAKRGPIPDDPEALPFAKQALRFFDEWGIDLDTDVVAAEASIINRAIGYAGTGDLWANIKMPGQDKALWLIDYKSSSTRPVDSVYPEYGLQLAALAHGETLLLDTGEETPCPGPVAGAAVLNLRQKSYELIPMPADGDLEAAFLGFRGALTTALYMYGRHDGPKPEAVPAPPKSTKRKAA